MLLVWLKFLACTLLIGAAGYQLSRSSDAISRHTGLSRTLIGVLLLATVTSLPELATAITSVTLADLPNIAVGDALGSCIFNLLVLLLLELAHPRASIYTLAAQSHILSAGFGVVLLGLAALAVLVGADLGTIAHVGVSTPVLLVAYVLAMRIVLRYELREARAAPPTTQSRPLARLQRELVGFLLATVVVLVAGIWLPFLGDELAVQMGWNNSFVGTLLVAFSTSVPEIAVALSALRLGAIDLAIGNLLGSNLFDIALIAVADIAYTRGPLLHEVSKAHVGTAISAMVMSGAVIAALFYRPAERTFRVFGWTGLFLLVVYSINAYVLHLIGR